MTATFNDAAAYLSNASSLSSVSSTTKLELYALFKYITVSPQPSTSRPYLFEVKERAKWDAWNTLGTKISSKSEAEAKYLEIAKSLGWEEGTADKNEPPQKEADAETEQEGDIWDSDDDSSTAKRSSGGGGGMGTAVSAMSAPEAVDESTLHGLAISNNLAGLTAMVEGGADLNAWDEFGYTPLHLAADRGHAPIVEYLLQRGADASIKDEDGLTARELADAAGHAEVVRMFVE
ncbi:hypothetical protein MKEN_00794300 [Mycena kentingensis (nom. inval.)]|nr:hypothetical protein MKEN_00794300 [Mycena kentingensis (nom. inval.)]